MTIEVTLLCSNKAHPIYPVLERWCQSNQEKVKAKLLNNVDSIKAGGDILFLVSCTEIVPPIIRRKFTYSLVIHASDLPHGRGWSPHIWDVILGKDKITVSLLNAEDRVDTGEIWQQRHIRLNGSELYDEINALLFEAEIDLISWACLNISITSPMPQRNDEPSYYKKRTPADSKIDINKSIREQFDLLRVCDPDRYPAFFEQNGRKFKLVIDRYDEK
mgnify:CR=1 FL=1